MRIIKYPAGLHCGHLRNVADGAAEKIIAAGGYIGGNRSLSMVKVYDLATNRWTKGIDLPVPLSRGAVVPFQTTFLVIGGQSSTTDRSNKVFHYTPDGNWEEMPHLQLGEPKSSVVAMTVSSSQLY